MILASLLGAVFLWADVAAGSIGCYLDSKDRVWPNGRNVLQMNSPHLCQKLCVGHLYAGLQHRTECFCGDSLPPTTLPAARCGLRCNGDATQTCGGTWALEVHHVAPSSPADSGTHLGCFQDSQQRVLSHGPHRLDNNSPQLCRNLCHGFRFIGLQGRFWCMCGDTMPRIKLGPGACGTNCPGAPGVKCGGNWTLDVYDSHDVNGQHSHADAMPAHNDGCSNQHLGCFEDNKDRVWKNGFNTLQDNSPHNCIQLCVGFKYAGLQFGSQCHCGDFLPPRHLPAQRCASACPGQPGATCGGNWAMEVYTGTPARPPDVVISTDVTYLGCYQDSVDERSWKNGLNIIAKSTPAVCKNLCVGYKYAGVKARNQCKCGNDIPPVLVHPTSCNSTCTGDRKLFCGWEYAMQVFGVTPKLQQEPTSHTHIGCYEDTKERVWKNGLSRFEFNSLQLCKTHCQGHRYFGLQSRLWCLCGDNVPPTAIDPKLCRANCPGDSNKCGGPWAMDVYEVSTSSFPTSPVTARPILAQCGRRKLPHAGQQLISGGSLANQEQFPWHVGIYQVDGSDSGLSQICGGTLISSSLVVSAAHCFWDANGKRKKDASLYKVAAGKLSRDWRRDDPGTQRRDASEIFVHEHYLGFDRQLAHDIAVLKVAVVFVINTAVNVVCVDWQNTLEQQQLHSGNLGTIAGWGITESDKVSDRLKFVRLPYVPLVACLAMVDTEFKAYLTEDKLCAGYVNKSTSVCSGDSGSGLVFPQRQTDGESYYLRGVASVGHVPSASSVSNCNNQQIAGFTLLSVYRAWIEQFVIFGRR